MPPINWGNQLPIAANSSQSNTWCERFRFSFKMFLKTLFVLLHVIAVIFAIDKVVIDNFGGDCSSDSLAVYKVTLEGHWSREHFPKHFPEVRPPAQFSKSFGVSHNSSFNLFKIDSIASAGLKEFCEKADFEEWENGEVDSGHIFDEFVIPKLSDPLDSVESRLFVESKNSLVSLVTKLIPSPDWFIGIESLQVSSELFNFLRPLLINQRLQIIHANWEFQSIRWISPDDIPSSINFDSPFLFRSCVGATVGSRKWAWKPDH